MSDEPTYRPRFRLTTLLLLLAVAALGIVCVKQAIEIKRLRADRRELFRAIIEGPKTAIHSEPWMPPSTSLVPPGRGRE